MFMHDSQIISCSSTQSGTAHLRCCRQTHAINNCCIKRVTELWCRVGALKLVEERSRSHPSVQPVLTHHTLDHLVFHLCSHVDMRTSTHTHGHTLSEGTPDWSEIRCRVLVSPGLLGRGRVGCRCSKAQKSSDCICLDC